jgi:hypothetical protein
MLIPLHPLHMKMKLHAFLLTMLFVNIKNGLLKETVKDKFRVLIASSLNACYYSVQKLLTNRLLSQHKIQKNNNCVTYFVCLRNMASYFEGRAKLKNV